jgi:hypothetical protein
MWVLIEMVHTICVEKRATPLNAVDLVALVKGVPQDRLHLVQLCR